MDKNQQKPRAEAIGIGSLKDIWNSSTPVSYIEAFNKHIEEKVRLEQENRHLKTMVEFLSKELARVKEECALQKVTNPTRLFIAFKERVKNK